MSTLKQSLNEIKTIKTDIKSALLNKSIDLTNVPFSGYAYQINNLPDPTSYYLKTQTSSAIELSSAFNSKANLDSPQFTGTPTVPTAISGNNQQILNIQALHTILGDTPVTDTISENSWVIPGTASELHKNSKLRLGTLTANTVCTLTISIDFLTLGNIVNLRVDNTNGGSLVYGSTELISTSDTGIWLLSFINLNNTIEILGQKVPIS